jgi:hypothetical protein
MDMKKYKTKIEIILTPVWHREPPLVAIKFSKDFFSKEYLKKQKKYVFEKEIPAGEYELSIDFLNKKNTDTVGQNDKALKIDKIILNGILSDKFIWEGIYQPTYPEPWASQQKILGKKLDKFIKPSTYMGWNGQWKLIYSVPLFSWIHKIENLGWIYD